MDNALNIESVAYSPRNETIRYDTGILKILAECDYLLTRHLIFLPSFMSTTLFHYQQCLEKYLKAYLAFREDYTFKHLKNGHNLSELLALCLPHDEFFQDPLLEAACTTLTPFAEVGRYPNDQMQQYGVSTPNAYRFLDEFVFKMRGFFQPRVEGENIADEIHLVHVYCTTPMGNQTVIAGQLMAAFGTDNEYAERIRGQFPVIN